jgi:hypothetical protein
LLVFSFFVLSLLPSLNFSLSPTLFYYLCFCLSVVVRLSLFLSCALSISLSLSNGDYYHWTATGKLFHSMNKGRKSQQCFNIMYTCILVKLVIFWHPLKLLMLIPLPFIKAYM